MVSLIEKLTKKHLNFSAACSLLEIPLDINPPEKQTSPIIEHDFIGQIPYFIVDAHKDAFYPWYFSGLRQATLLHLDEHSDSCSYLPLTSFDSKLKNGEASQEEVLSYLSYLTNINFIAAAVACGLVARTLWFQPSTNRLWTKEKVLEPLILDVDLDAFDCFLPLVYLTSKKRKISSFEKLKRAIDFLTDLPAPSLITIARSQTPCYVPPNSVDGLQDCLLTKLRELY